MIRKITLIQLFYGFVLFVITFIILREYNHSYLVADSSIEKLLQPYKTMIANDSRRYYQIYIEANEQIKNIYPLIFINKNLIPPVLTLFIAQGNLDILYFIYFFFLFYSIYSIMKYIRYNRKIILFLLLFYPIVISNLYAPNKEISSLISILFLLSYILSEKKKFLYWSIIFALLTRFELFIVIIIFVFFRKIKIIKRRNIIFILLIFVSVAITQSSDRGTYFLGSTGVMTFISKLDSYGLHFITIYFKFFMNLYSLGLVATIKGVNTFFIVASSWYFIIISIIIFKRKILSFNNDIVFFISIYSIIFTSTAFVQHRYFIAMYPMFVYLAFANKKEMTMRRFI